MWSDGIRDTGWSSNTSICSHGMEYSFYKTTFDIWFERISVDKSID